MNITEQASVILKALEQAAHAPRESLVERWQALESSIPGDWGLNPSAWECVMGMLVGKCDAEGLALVLDVLNVWTVHCADHHWKAIHHITTELTIRLWDLRES